MGVRKNFSATEFKEEGTVDSNKDFPKWMCWKKRRHVVALLAFLGFFNMYALRVNLSIAIVAMVQINEEELENGTIINTQEFDWDYQQQQTLLGSFFYGYITTQIFGGWLSSKIGGKKVFGVGLGVAALLTLITPWMAYASYYLLLTVRIVEGVFEGATFPCIHALWEKWAPPLERSTLASFAFSGLYVGTVVSMPTCAYLAEAWGWPSIFYVYGGIAIVWFFLWWWIVAESPAEDPYISKEELDYIQNSLGQTKNDEKVRHPWKSILCSIPVWAIVVSHFCENWGFYTLLTQMPTFMSSVLDFNLGKTGLLSAVPYLAMAVMLQFSGHCADWFQIRGYLTTTQVRKIFNCAAFIAQTVFMLATAYVMNPVGSVTCLTLAVGLGAFAWPGFSVNYLDVAPQHASVIMGLGNTFATIPGIVSPSISGLIVQTGSADEWRIVFYITAGIYLFGAVFYGTFASGKLQPWAVKANSVGNQEEKPGIANASFGKNVV